MEGKLTPEEYYLAGLRALTGGQRVQMAFRLYDLAKDACRAGIRARHPEYTAEEVEAELHRRIEYDRARSARARHQRTG